MLGVMFYVCCIDAYLSTVFIKCSNASHLLGFYVVAIIHLSEVTLPHAETLKNGCFGDSPLPLNHKFEFEFYCTFSKSKKVTKSLDIKHIRKNIIIKYTYTRTNRG
jgi:hypothetical protein